MNLYEIGKDLQEIKESIEQGKFTNYDAKPVRDLIKENLKQESEGFVFMFREANADIDAIDREIKRLQNLKKEKMEYRDNLKEEVKGAMAEFGMKSIETAYGNVTLKKPQPSVIVTDLKEIPEEFVNIKEKIEIKADKNKIKAHFRETGEILPGTEIEMNSSLIIPKIDKEEKQEGEE